MKRQMDPRLINIVNIAPKIKTAIEPLEPFCARRHVDEVAKLWV
jgi:hypothetical protein